jgi:hypothetical protein
MLEMFSELKLRFSMSDDNLKEYSRDFPGVRGVLGVEENQLEDADVNGWILSILI